MKKDVLWVSFYSYTCIIVSTECELLIHILSITYFISTDVCTIVLLGLCSAHRCLHSCSLFQRGIFFFTQKQSCKVFLLFCCAFILFLFKTLRRFFFSLHWRKKKKILPERWSWELNQERSENKAHYLYFCSFFESHKVFCILEAHEL